MVIKSLLALAILGAASADTVKLTRTYPETQAKSYAVFAENKDREFVFTGDFTFKVAGKAKDSLTPVKVTCPAAKVTIQGNVAEEDAIDTTLSYDSNNMPDNFDLEGNMIAVVVLSISGFVPNADVEVGKPFEVKWDKAGTTFKGKGTLERIETKDGVKIASVKTVADFVQSADRALKLEVLSEIDSADGSMIGAKGKITVNESDVYEFTIKPKAQ